MSLEPGTQIAQYRLQRQLGAGGMGEVYLAHDTRLDRQVAIKFLMAPADEHARHRLLREARAAAALDHPNICAVYEVGSDPVGGDFIAMQYAQGETLASRLRRGRMRPDEALGFGAQIAEALMVAHRRGIVHRDLKPQNIIVTPAGTPKLLDFGLATLSPTAPAALEATTTSAVTEPGTVVGTPAYMAPEQVRNEPADARSDVFALGCVMYECLTGRRAFSAATTAETLGQVLHVDPPSVSSVVPQVGPAYDAMCARLLHKVPAERFQSAEEVLGAIRALTPSARLSADPSPLPPTRRPARWPLRLAVAMAIVAVGAVGYRFRPRGPALPVASPDAVRWYDLGVEAMRDGTYAAAQSAFDEAIRLSPAYPQAYSRLAEARIALDDERGAREALLQVATLVPDRSRLDVEDRLHFDAASAAALRQHAEAATAYRELARRQPADAGRWLDVGRAEEGAQRSAAAREAYARALEADGLSAAAHLRAGVLQVRGGQTAEGLASIDEAIRLYRAAARAEGEAEAVLRKGVALNQIGQSAAAREYLDAAAASNFAAQRVPAQFELARVSYAAGQLTAAQEQVTRAVADANSAGLSTLAAGGLVDLGITLMLRELYDQADAQFAEAIRLASDRGATRVEMRARLQQASLRLQTGRPEDALDLAAAPADYFKAAGEARLTADADLIRSRANESLDRFDEASRLATDAMTFAETAGDDVRLAVALENLAGQLTKLGRLPEALTHRERIDAIHRRLKDEFSLPFDLTNHAELLILLGRGREAEDLLKEVDRGIEAGGQSYVGRRARVALLRALLASTERRWADVGRLAAGIEAAAPKPAPGSSAKPGYTVLFARVLGEHARAQLGQSRRPTSDVAAWPLDAPGAVDRRELTAWVAGILLARGESAEALRLSSAVLEEDATKANPELAWRLAAVAAQAARRSPSPGARDQFATLARAYVERIKSVWDGSATAYLARPDLSSLLKTVQ